MTPELEAELTLAPLRAIENAECAAQLGVSDYELRESLERNIAQELRRIASLIAEEAARICEDNQVETVLGGGARRLAKFDKETEARHEGQVYAAEIRRQLKGEG